MSPQARKFENALNFPTIAPSILVVDAHRVSFSNLSKLSVAHNVKLSKGLMKDWMSFTNVIGNGIFDNI